MNSDQRGNVYDSPRPSGDGGGGPARRQFLRLYPSAGEAWNQASRRVTGALERVRGKFENTRTRITGALRLRRESGETGEPEPVQTGRRRGQEGPPLGSGSNPNDIAEGTATPEQGSQENYPPAVSHYPPLFPESLEGVYSNFIDSDLPTRIDRYGTIRTEVHSALAWMGDENRRRRLRDIGVPEELYDRWTEPINTLERELEQGGIENNQAFRTNYTVLAGIVLETRNLQEQHLGDQLRQRLEYIGGPSGPPPEYSGSNFGSGSNPNDIAEGTATPEQGSQENYPPAVSHYPNFMEYGLGVPLPWAREFPPPYAPD